MEMARKPVCETWLAQSADQALRRQRLLISYVGATAIALPFVLLLTDIAFGPNCLRNSLSHYYYGRPGGDIFVMVLAFIGTLLMAYRAEARWISRLAGVAGLAAICVGLFPTVDTGCAQGAFEARVFADVAQGVVTLAADPFVLFPMVQYIHYVAVAVLFAIMIYFCAFVFTAVGTRDKHPVSKEIIEIKLLRNKIYLICAGVMAVILAILALSFVFPAVFAPFERLVLIAEWIALTAFGVAWLVKGRVFASRLGP